MTRPVVLDAAAVDGLVSPTMPEALRVALEAARRLGRDVIVPSLVLAECYRDRPHVQAIDALLARDRGILLRDTDRVLARIVGGLLATARFGSEVIVDAHVVAAAVERGGGVCVTGDPDDLERLAAAVPAVEVMVI